MAELSVNVTPQAAKEIRNQLARRAQSNPQSGVRLGVKGGGCSGMSYVIEYCDQPRARDQVFEVEGARVYVDPKSLIYLAGTTFDFVDTFQQKGFKFVNPQVKAESGCSGSLTVCPTHTDGNASCMF